MGIEAKFTEKDVSRHFDNFLATIEKRQIIRFQYLGEICVEHARTIPPEVGFMDQTGNLRSSIGYVIFKDGVAIRDNFMLVKAGSEGAKTGKMIAEKVAARHPEGIVLVVVAGMHYALHVEAKGRDVLASTEHLAQSELPKMISDLVQNIYKAIE